MIRLRGRPASPSVFRRSSSRRARSSSGRGSQRVCGGGPPTSCCVFVVVSLQFPGDPSAWTDHVRVNERLRSLRPERALSSSRGMCFKLLSRTHSPSQGACKHAGRIFCLYAVSGDPPDFLSTRKGAKSVHGRHRVAGVVAEGLCGNARVLAFCARRELARGLCACWFVFGFWSPRSVNLVMVPLQKDVKQQGKSTLACGIFGFGKNQIFSETCSPLHLTTVLVHHPGFGGKVEKAE